jgi:negative regulator of genetic competence, sporulation and motility
MDWWDNRDKEISALKSLIEERKERARLEAENASFKDSGPESEEIISMSDHTERTVTARKKKDTTETKGFDQVERFRPSIPHQQSKEQLDEYLEKRSKMQEKMKRRAYLIIC